MAKLFFASLTVALVALTLAAPAPRKSFPRRIQGDEANMCDISKLNDHITALMDDPSCMKGLTAFLDTLSDETLSSTDQAKALDELCASSCGQPFDAATVEWRDWCDVNRDSFQSMGPAKALTFYNADTFIGSALTMGCAKANATGPYCAVAVATWDEDGADCDFASSCCMGEMLL